MFLMFTNLKLQNRNFIGGYTGFSLICSIFSQSQKLMLLLFWIGLLAECWLSALNHILNKVGQIQLGEMSQSKTFFETYL